MAEPGIGDRTGRHEDGRRRDIGAERDPGQAEAPVGQAERQHGHEAEQRHGAPALGVDGVGQPLDAAAPAGDPAAGPVAGEVACREEPARGADGGAGERQNRTPGRPEQHTAGQRQQRSRQEQHDAGREGGDVGDRPPGAEPADRGGQGRIHRRRVEGAALRHRPDQSRCHAEQQKQPRRRAPGGGWVRGPSAHACPPVPGFAAPHVGPHSAPAKGAAARRLRRGVSEGLRPHERRRITLPARADGLPIHAEPGEPDGVAAAVGVFGVVVQDTEAVGVEQGAVFRGVEAGVVERFALPLADRFADGRAAGEHQRRPPHQRSWRYSLEAKCDIELL